MISRRSFDLSALPTLTFWMSGQNSKAYWQNVKVSWSSVAGPLENSPQSLISFVARPENSTESFQYGVASDCFIESWHDADHHDTWIFYKISINDNGTVSFYRDGQALWTSRVALDLDSISYQKIELSGQSVLGLQLIDDIAVTLPAEDSSEEDVVPGWRRWEGMTGAVDKPINLTRSHQGEKTTPQNVDVTMAAFHTNSQKWSADQFEFDFKLNSQRATYAPAYFYRDHSFGGSSQIKVQLSQGELRVFQGAWGPFTELTALVHDFKPDVRYHCKIDVAQERMGVYRNDALLASSLRLPTHLEAQKLSASNQLLLVWLVPDNKAFSHLQIYRSTDQNEEGVLLADHVTGMTYVDKTVSPGTTYYYRLYPVDVAGHVNRKAANLTVFRGGSSAFYRSFSEMPAVDAAHPIVIDGQTIVTMPFVASSHATTDYLPASTKAFSFHPANNSWQETQTLKAGKGYTLRGKSGLLAVGGERLSDKPFDVTLQRGWNAIGNPFLIPVTVDQITVTAAGQTIPFLQAVEEGLIADYLYGYVEKKWYITSIVEPSFEMPPWRGIYLLSSVRAKVTFSPDVNE